LITFCRWIRSIFPTLRSNAAPAIGKTCSRWKPKKTSAKRTACFRREKRKGESRHDLDHKRSACRSFTLRKANASQQNASGRETPAARRGKAYLLRRW
jgi:hypothetical protein